MNSKVKREYDLLVKLGFSHEIAYIMAQQKHNNQLDEEAKQYIDNLKEENKELEDAISEFGFVKLSDSIIPEASER